MPNQDMPLGHGAVSEVVGQVMRGVVGEARPWGWGTAPTWAGGRAGLAPLGR